VLKPGDWFKAGVGSEFNQTSLEKPKNIVRISEI
jgi:hypothetical protein